MRVSGMGALYRTRGARSAVARYPEDSEAQTAETVTVTARVQPAVDTRSRSRHAGIYARRTQRHFGRWQDYKLLCTKWARCLTRQSG